MVIAYVIWIVLAAVLYFLLPGLFPQTASNPIAYSLFISFGISVLFVVLKYIKNLKIPEHNENELSDNDSLNDVDFLDFTGQTIPATRVVDKESIRGELTFSNNGIKFTPKAYSIQNEPAGWRYSEIRTIDDGVMNNITFTTTDGDTEILVVKRTSEVTDYLKHKIIATRKK